jgi:hypothetical protein
MELELVLDLYSSMFFKRIAGSGERKSIERKLGQGVAGKMLAFIARASTTHIHRAATFPPLKVWAVYGGG